MRHTPVILVTAPVREDEGHPRVRLMRAYLTALEHAGLASFVSPPTPHTEWAESMLDRVDGLLLTGGEDVDPARYATNRHDAVGDVSTDRNAWEYALVHEARRRLLPTLAICRGIQLSNVAFGGTLIQDLPSERPGIDHAPNIARNVRSHPLTVTPNSRAAAALGATELTVNSIHHQAVDRVAAGFHATAHAPDGTIEAIEPDDDAWWMLAVQWHPEELESATGSLDRGIFRAFAHTIATA